MKDARYVRVNRSCVVNLEHVGCIDGGRIYLTDMTLSFSIGDKYKEAIYKELTVIKTT